MSEGPARFARPARAAIILGVLLALALPALGYGDPGPPAASAARAAPLTDARVLGTFTMLARVLSVAGVPGEHAGQTLKRTWAVAPSGCSGSVCSALTLLRERGSHLIQRVLLHRTAPGRYAGSGVFFVALRCRRRTYRLGSRAPFRITLAVTGSQPVQAVRFARKVTATYVNPMRTDSTPCPLPRVHEKAAYSGSATSPLPTPPAAAFTVTTSPATTQASFKDTSSRGTGGAAVVGWSWSFGDPASGSANTATVPDPAHTYSAPGTYTVTLTVVDANGLTATARQQVTVPAVPSPQPRPAAAPGGPAKPGPAGSPRTGSTERPPR